MPRSRSSSSIPGLPVPTPISKRPSVTTDSEWASHAVLHSGRSGEAYTQVPTRRSVRAAARARVGPGAGCYRGTSGIRSVEYPLSARRRMRSRHVGRSVRIGTVTPNRNGRGPRVVLESVIACPFVARIGAPLVGQRGAVDAFLGAAVERSAFEDVDELVGCPLSERAKSTGRAPGLTGGERGLGH